MVGLVQTRAPFSSVRVTYLEKPLSASALKILWPQWPVTGLLLTAAVVDLQTCSMSVVRTATTVTNSSSSAESNEVPASMRGVSFMLMGGTGHGG